MKKNSTLLRLRKANPYPLPATVDEGDLLRPHHGAAAGLETAPPRNTSPSARARPRSLVRGHGAARIHRVCALHLGLHQRRQTGRDEGGIPPGPARLPLPPGYSWPVLYVDPNSVTSPGAGGGHAVLISQNAWECYWVKAIRNGDKAAQRRAHAELSTLLANNILVAPVGAPEDWRPPNPPDAPYAVFAHDGGLNWVRHTYKLAATGDPRQLRQSCRANSPR